MRATVLVTFEDDLRPATAYERTVEFTELRDPGGDEFASGYLFANLEKETRWGRYWLSMPDVSRFYRVVKQSFRPEDLSSGDYEDRTNTRALWMEIGHTLLRVKSLLAKSRAFHEVQQTISGGGEAENVVWHIHLDKMDAFDLCTIFLGKVNELAARLIFERLGASLIPGLDRDKPNWEREVTWSKIRNGLANRTDNPNVALLSDPEYQGVQEILAGFVNLEAAKRLLDYEHKFVHRITPSVDTPGFYTRLESRVRTPIIDDKTGQHKGWTKSIDAWVSPEYAFLDLYADALDTLRHYVILLDRLDAIPLFGPEALATGRTD